MFKKLTAEEQAAKEKAQRDELFTYYGLDFENYSSEQLRDLNANNMQTAASRVKRTNEIVGTKTDIGQVALAISSQSWAIIRQNEELLRYSAHLAQQNEQIIRQNEELAELLKADTSD
ncbi:MAG: hypothetical protein FWE48_07345 [Coriobacteriia bacterium]|nr:hypothetical protein [Coriobacteriia bacterium]